MEVFAKTSQSMYPNSVFNKSTPIRHSNYVWWKQQRADEDVAHNTIEVRVINHLTGEGTRLEVLRTRPHQLMRQSSSMLRNTSVSYSIASQGDYCFPISFALIDCEIQMIYLRLGICLATQRREVSFLQNSNSRNRRGVRTHEETCRARWCRSKLLSLCGYRNR